MPILNILCNCCREGMSSRLIQCLQYFSFTVFIKQYFLSMDTRSFSVILRCSGHELPVCFSTMFVVLYYRKTQRIISVKIVTIGPLVISGDQVLEIIWFYELYFLVYHDVQFECHAVGTRIIVAMPDTNANNKRLTAKSLFFHKKQMCSYFEIQAQRFLAIFVLCY